MTLRDLANLIRHFWKWVVIVPVVCALLVGGLVFARQVSAGESYSATAKLTVTDPSGVLNQNNLSNLVGAVAQGRPSAQADGSISVKTDSLTQSVEFSAQSPTAEGAMSLANQAAMKTADDVRAILAEQAVEYSEAASEVSDTLSSTSTLLASSATSSADRVAALQSCVFTVTEADSALSNSSSGTIRYAFVGFFGGLFVVVCLLALFDSVRRPVKSVDDLTRVTDLPILAKESQGSWGEHLWANIQFSTNAEISSVCLVPVSERDGMDEEAQQLVRCAAGDEPRSKIFVVGQNDAAALADAAPVAVVLCDSLAVNVQGAYLANKASVTVVLVRRWTDNASSVADTLRELHLARANVVGVALF